MAAIEKGFAGPKDSRGKQVYPGFFYDTGIAAQGGGIPGLLNPGTSPVGGPVAAVTQDVDAEAAVADNNPVSRIGDSSSWVNLNSFSSHGGKLIFYHGVSDPWFSAKDTVDYYQRVAAASGGEAKLKGWSRLFLSPGMGHCGGGSATLDTFDMLSASVAWVEKGQAPQSVIATGRAFPGRSRVRLSGACPIQGTGQCGRRRELCLPAIVPGPPGCGYVSQPPPSAAYNCTRVSRSFRRARERLNCAEK